MSTLDNRRGLDQVRVTKDKLIEQIRLNRLKHIDEYAEAYRTWRDKYLAFLVEVTQVSAQIGDCLDATEDPDMDDLVNKVAKFMVATPKPVHHLSDYEETLALLECCEDNEFVLDRTTWRQYWLDDWSWKNAFTATNSRYKV